MKDSKEYEKDLASIRVLMERSAKFISLSGLSGILAGLYALCGAAFAYYLIYYPYSPFGIRSHHVNEESVITKLLTTAVVVLVFSLGTGYLLSIRKAKKMGTSVWNRTSRQLTVNLLIPLAAGGLFILILISRGYFMMVAPSCLIFYGLALVNASQHTYEEVRYLGLIEIILGLVTALLPGYSLIFWATGFGILHIIYGAVMHYRYDT